MKKLFFAVLLIAVTLGVGLYFNNREECSKYNLCFPKKISWVFSLREINPREARINEWMNRIHKFAISHPEKKHYCSQLLISALDKVDNENTCDGAIYLRNRLINIMAEIGDPSIIEPLMKEIMEPKDTIVTGAGCKGGKASSLSAAVHALKKMGKRLEEIPIKWGELFCLNPSVASVLLTEIMTSDKSVSFEEWQSLKLTNNEIIDAGLVALNDCKNEDCIFWLAPLMTHVEDKEKVVAVMESLLKEKVDKISWSTKYSLEMSLKFLKEGKVFCISEDLFNYHERLERGVSLQGLRNAVDYRHREELIKQEKDEKIVALTSEDYILQDCMISRAFDSYNLLGGGTVFNKISVSNGMKY